MPLPSVAFDCRADLEGVAAVVERGGVAVAAGGCVGGGGGCRVDYI